MTDKPQRIRDPLHDLINFNGELTERLCWQIIQTEEFQRLRRIKQLGFSDYVYPGASHTRFAHSLGVFHIARKLLNILQHDFPKDYNSIKAQHTLVAALLHDIGHGPFSHAFENFLAACDFGKKDHGHERKSIRIIKETEVGKILRRGFNSSSCPEDIAAILDSETTVADYHDAIVSSLFDADRLDYMQRDRLMTGTQLGGIDFSWLLANLTFGEVAAGTDDQETSNHKTFVLNAKAIPAAESYVLALFQLYPTVYFHKTTRCFEVLYTQLLKKLH
ncbi:MAG: HD domain-containing protein, partial [Deltaproteobacteria bacterium]|nr:HD domain-containing protein [Deltaproteobacteria bacterium]